MQSIKTVLLYRSDRQDFAAKLSADIKANIEEHDTKVTLLTVEDFLSAEDISDISSIFGLFDDPDTVMDDAFANALSRASNIITPFVPVFFSEKYLQKGANIPFVITYIMGLARQAVKAWEKNYDELVVAISGAMISIAAEKKAQPAAHSSTDEKPKISTDYDVEMQNGYYWLERCRNHPEASRSDVKMDLDKAHECFDRAAKLNPDMAAPYVGILECYAAERYTMDFERTLSTIDRLLGKLNTVADSTHMNTYKNAVLSVLDRYIYHEKGKFESDDYCVLSDASNEAKNILSLKCLSFSFCADQKEKILSYINNAEKRMKKITRADDAKDIIYNIIHVIAYAGLILNFLIYAFAESHYSAILHVVSEGAYPVSIGGSFWILLAINAAIIVIASLLVKLITDDVPMIMMNFDWFVSDYANIFVSYPIIAAIGSVIELIIVSLIF